MADRNIITRIILTARDETVSVFSSFQAKAAAVAAAVAGYFSVDFLRGAVGSAADFEAAMSRVQAATGASGDELASLKRAAEDAGASTKFTGVQAAQALENLAKSGLNASEAIAALPGVLALAEAGDMDLAESAAVVTRTVAGMGVAVEEAARIADVLAQGANASNTSVKGLADALSYAAPTARAAGLSLEQTVSYIGKFADAGIDASRAGTALNSILSQFQDPASKFRGELASIGITTSDFDKALRQLVVSGKDGEKAIIAVGTEAGPALRGLINQGLGALDDLKGKLDNAAGSAARTSETMGANLNGALSGLSSAWDTLKIKLGEPVLGAATQAVKDLTDGIKGAVSNGTISAFGEAIRSAFVSGAEWVRKFVAELDPAALSARLQAGAGQVGEWFDKLAESARNAGDIVRTAYGVMSAGTSTVLGSIYKIAEVFSAITFAVLKDAAAIADGFSKITFGGVSESFKWMANELRTQAGAAAAVAEEFGRRSSAAFDSVVEGADLAAKGWQGLTRPAQQAATDIAAVASASKDASTEGARVGQVLEEAGKKAQTSATEQKQAATTTAESVKALREEYDKLVAGGDANGAVKKLQEINAALSSTRETAKDTADALKAAYEKMGLSSKADLDRQAAEYRGYYERIKADGTATADIVAKAFEVYAEKAIAANGGLVTAALRGEAALRGLSIEADGASVRIEQIGAAGLQAGQRVQSGMSAASSSISRMRSDAERLADQLASLKTPGIQTGSSMSGANGTYEDMRRAGVTPAQLQNAGYSAREIEDYALGNDRAMPGYVNRVVSTSSVNSYSLGVQRGLNDEEAKKFAEIYNFYAEQANLKARNMRTLGSAESLRDEYIGLQNAAIEEALAAAKQAVGQEALAARKASQQSGVETGGGFQFGNRGNNVITLRLVDTSNNVSNINLSDAESADALVRALQQSKLVRS